MMAFVLCYELNNVLLHCAISLSCIMAYNRNMRKAQCKRVDGKLYIRCRKTKATEVCAQPLPNGDLIGNGFLPPLPMNAFTSVTGSGTRTLSPFPKGVLARFRCVVLY